MKDTAAPSPSSSFMGHDTKEDGLSHSQHGNLPHPPPHTLPVVPPLLQTSSSHRMLLSRGQSGRFGGSSKDMPAAGPEEVVAKVKRLLEEHHKELLRVREDEVSREHLK